MNLTHGMGMGMGYVAVDNTATLGLLCYMLPMVTCVKWCKAWQARGAVWQGHGPASERTLWSNLMRGLGVAALLRLTTIYGIYLCMVLT